MTTDKKNRLIKLKKQFNCSLFIAPLLLTKTFACHADDLVSGTDLQNSPLSLSLATSLVVTMNNTVQHLAINQYGINNQVIVNQTADMVNGVKITQNGTHNLANVTQSGANNTVNLLQQGYGNLVDVFQEGDANTVNVTQTGEQTFVVHQIGNKMLVNITQYKN
ncbi:curlin subunit CsgB [Pseudoalteromonas phenolica]|uniref:Curlin subunit CsgB n=1 Tax=Pseudoalteromonas phenolica TaxID=161398 RepID=A0A4Q7IR73_9GAMM|nr:curlin subunit CsgB [Pseudoalteromonas phenolica]RZQ54402.1 curlin subunit CsgB [Pseudoalteromonas phenolica]